MSVLAFGIFFTIFSLVLALINFAVLKGILLAVGLKFPVLFIGVTAIILSLCFVGATLLSRAYSGVIVKCFYMTAAYWVGFSLMAIFIFPFSCLAALLFKEYKQTLFIAGFTLALLAAVYAAIHALDRKVKETMIPFKANLTLVQISDVHFGVVNGPKYLVELVKKINGLNPDAVLFTGDLVDGTTHLEKETLLPLKALKAPAYFVSGNHDYFDGVERVYKAVEEAGVFVLDNKSVEVKGVQIGGINYSIQKTHLREALSSLKWKNEKPRILMYHEPKDIQDAEASGVDLMLSGHTHGGQIIPFNFLVRIPFKYMKGLYKTGNMQLFVSTGCGTWGPKMRLGTDSEINLLRLKKQQKS